MNSRLLEEEVCITSFFLSQRSSNRSFTCLNLCLYFIMKEAKLMGFCLFINQHVENYLFEYGTYFFLGNIFQCIQVPIFDLKYIQPRISLSYNTISVGNDFRAPAWDARLSYPLRKIKMLRFFPPFKLWAFTCSSKISTISSLKRFPNSVFPSQSFLFSRPEFLSIRPLKSS